MFFYNLWKITQHENMLRKHMSRVMTKPRGFRISPTQTKLYKPRRWLQAGNFGFRKKRNYTIHVAQTKALNSFPVTAKLICAFVFAYAKCWFLITRLIYMYIYWEEQLFNVTGLVKANLTKGLQLPCCKAFFLVYYAHQIA